MKTIQFGFLLLGLLAFNCAQKDDLSNQIVIGTVDSVFSNTLNEQRKIWVYVPNSGAGSIYSKQKYPVLYLLDGDDHFHSVTGLLQQLSGNGLCPQMIVVGIPNTDRSRDLTPTHSLKLPDGKDQDFLKTSGGAENFTLFLEKELIPHIESHYPTLPHRILVGHSFGGLFAINALLKHPEIFNSYVSIDPSMWWDNRKLLKQSDSILHSNKFKGKTLFLAVANTMRSGMDTLHVVKDTTSNTSHIRSILEFARQVGSPTGDDLRFNWKYYDQDSHGSVPLIAEYDALRSIFDYYRFPAEQDFDLDLLTKHYKHVSEKIGYEMLPPEQVVNNLGYTQMQKKNFDEAYSLFELNIKNYPESQNVYDSMGDFYVEKGDTAKAVEYFTKALGVREVPGTRQKLEKLQKGEK